MSLLPTLFKLCISQVQNYTRQIVKTIQHQSCKDFLGLQLDKVIKYGLNTSELLNLCFRHHKFNIFFKKFPFSWSVHVLLFLFLCLLVGFVKICRSILLFTSFYFLFCAFGITMLHIHSIGFQSNEKQHVKYCIQFALGNGTCGSDW